jgi:NAD(P)-dependent dehydrogenase (short-subunit alcohol dehydrogenase family)
MNRRLEGKIAIVCGAGASQGGVSIGMASAMTLARQGARVFAVDRDASLAQPTQAAIQQDGGEVLLHECDVTQPEAVAGMVEACRSAYGQIDILFNNVGMFLTGGPLDTTEDDFDRLLTVNLKAMFLTVRAVLPTMLEHGGGAIVNNASICAIRYQMPSTIYSISKAGVLQLTQNVGVQYASRGIRCNSVLPGNIVTDRLTTRLKKSFGDDYVTHVNAWGEQVPSGEPGSPWDVANAVAFLASDEARYVNATELVVDGGLSASVVGHRS